MARPTGQLDRSIAAVSVHVPQRSEFLRRKLADTHAGEYDQQVHLPFSGVAQAWETGTQSFVWERPFLYAPTQRLVPFKTPHITGAEVEFLQDGGEFINWKISLVGWIVTDEGWHIGGTVRISHEAPLADGPVPFSAIAHLTFQGYATYAEGGEFTT